MATVNKNFRIKDGLIVEGTTGTINGDNIVTENASQTLSSKEFNGETKFHAANGAGSLSINLDGTYGTTTITGNNGDLNLVTNNGNIVLNADNTVYLDSVYAGNEVVSKSYVDSNPGNFVDSTGATNAAAELLTGATLTNITITGDGSGLTITAENGVADSTTDDLVEGTTNKYFTAQRAIDAVGGSATSENTPSTVVKRDTSGNFAAGNITANQVTVQTAGTIFEDSGFNVVSTTGNDLNLYGTAGVNITAANADIVLNADGSVYKGSVSTSNELVTQGRLNAYIGDNTVDSSTGNTITDRIGSVASDLSTHIQDTSTHGVTGDIVGTSDVQVLTNKTINDELFFTNPSTQASDAGIKINDVSEDLEIVAYTANMHLTASQDVTITSNNGDIVLNPDGGAYISSVSAGNQIATNSYVDNAVSGLAWKEAVNLLWDDANAGLTGSTGTLVIDGHTALTDANNGYRILIKNGDNRGIWSYADDTTSWTLTRTADADAVGELLGAAVYVMEGTTYGKTSWVQGNHYATAFADQVWTQFSGSGSVLAGSGITVDGLEVSIDRTTVDTWYDEAGAVSTHSALTTGVHGVTGDVVGTTDSQSLSNKTIMGQTYFQSGGGAGGTNNYIDVNNSTGKLRVHSGYSLDLNSSGDVTLESTGGDVVVNPDGILRVNSSITGQSMSLIGGSIYGPAGSGTTGLTLTTGQDVSAIKVQNDGNVILYPYAGGAYVGGDSSTQEIATHGWVDTNYLSVDTYTTQIADYVPLTQKGAANGIATLDVDGQVPSSQLGNVPAAYVTSVGTNLSVSTGQLNLSRDMYIDDINLGSNNSGFPSTKIYGYETYLGGSTATEIFSFDSAHFTVAELFVKYTNVSADVEVSKVLIAIDGLGNAAVTEYGLVSTNASISNISVVVTGGIVSVKIAAAAGTVVVAATLLGL